MFLGVFSNMPLTYQVLKTNITQKVSAVNRATFSEAEVPESPSRLHK